MSRGAPEMFRIPFEAAYDKRCKLNWASFQINSPPGLEII
jgi:hypothetical protein